MTFITQNLILVHYYHVTIISIADYDECVGIVDPCLNGGTCENRNGSYNCICPKGWTGQFCGEGIPCCYFYENIAEFCCLHNIIDL